jgi:hypothetical protein
LISLARIYPDQGQVHNVADDLPLRRLLALLSMAHSGISVDTGPAHAAAAPARCRSSRGLPSTQPTPHPDIGHITVQQAFAGWCDASLEQSSY